MENSPTQQQTDTANKTHGHTTQQHHDIIKKQQRKQNKTQHTHTPFTKKPRHKTKTEN